MKKQVSIIVALLLSLSGYTQDTYHKKIVNSTGYEETVQAYFQATDNSYFHVYYKVNQPYVTGTFPDSELFVIKFSECGEKLIEKKVDFPAGFQFHHSDLDQNFAVPADNGGFILVSITSTGDIEVIKFSSLIEPIWQTQIVGNSAGLLPEDVLYTSANKVVITGRADQGDPLSPFSGMIAFQLDGISGGLDWDILYGENDLYGDINRDYYPDEIIELNDGNYAVVGYYVPSDIPIQSGFLVRLNKNNGFPFGNGNKGFHSFNSSGNTQKILVFTDVDLKSNGELAITGFSESVNGGTGFELTRVDLNPVGNNVNITDSYQVGFNDFSPMQSQFETVVNGNTVFTAVGVKSSVSNNGVINEMWTNRIIRDYGANVNAVSMAPITGVSGGDGKSTITLSNSNELLLASEAKLNNSNPNDEYTYHYNLDENGEYGNGCSQIIDVVQNDLILNHESIDFEDFSAGLTLTPTYFIAPFAQTIDQMECCTIEFDSLSSDVTICEGEFIDLYASTECPSTITWHDPLGSLVGTGNSLSLNDPIADYYTVTAINGECVGTDIIAINFLNPQPVQEEFTVCENDPEFVFFTTSFVDYGAGNIVINNGNYHPALGYQTPVFPDFNITFDPSAVGPGTYIIPICNTTSTTDCCTDVVFVVTQAPDVQNTILCLNDAPVQIVPILPANYCSISYHGDIYGINQNTNQFDPVLAGVGSHTFEVCYEGCGQEDYPCCTEVTFVVQAAPNVTALSNFVQFCTNDPEVTVCNYGFGSVYPQSQNGQQYFSPNPFLWLGQNSYFNSIPGLTYTGGGFGQVKFDPTLAGPGIHTLVYTIETSNGCSNTASIDLIVNPTPEPQIDSYDLCANDLAFSLLPSFPVNGVCEIIYYGELSGVDEDNNTFNPAMAITGANTFDICYKSCGLIPVECCTTITINVQNAPLISAASDVVMCELDNPLNIGLCVLSNYYNFNPNGYFTPNVWFGSGQYGYFDPAPGLTTPSFGTVTFNPAGNIGTNPIVFNTGYFGSNNCISSATLNIVVCPPPTIGITVYGPACNPTSLYANVGIPANGCPTGTISWQTPCGPQTGQSIPFCGDGQYIASVQTAGANCVASEIINISTSTEALLIADEILYLCKGETLTVDALIPASADPSTLVWTHNGNPYDAAPSILVWQDGIYCINGLSNDGCDLIEACVEVISTSAPLPGITINSLCPEGDIDLEAYGLGSSCSPADLTYQWFDQNGPIDQIANPSAGTSHLIITNSNYQPGDQIWVEICCGNCCTESKKLTIKKDPEINILQVPEIDLCQDPDAQISIYSLFTSDGTNCQITSTAAGFDVNTGFFDAGFAGPGNYSFDVTCGTDGCYDYATINLSVVDNNSWHQTTEFTNYRDENRDVITDSQGNVYVCGLYMKETTFNGGNNSSVTISDGSGPSDLDPYSFLAKYDDCGNLLWIANSQASPSGKSNYANKIVLDEENGLVYIAGNLSQELYFNDGEGDLASLAQTAASTSVQSGTHGYVASFNMIGGDINYVELIALDAYTSLTSLTINDNTGQIFVGGHKNEDPSLSTIENKIWLRKYSPSLLSLGTPDWTIEGLKPGNQYLNDIDFDEDLGPNGSVWLIGEYDYALYLTTSPGTGTVFNNMNNGNLDAFVARIEDGPTPTPGFLVKGNAANGEMTGKSIAIDDANNVAYVTGWYKDKLNDAFTNTNQDLTNTTTSANAYFMKINENGNLDWPNQRFAEVNSNEAYGLGAHYHNGAAYFSGNFFGSDVLFDNTNTLLWMGQNANYQHTYVVSYDDNGNYVWSNGTMDITGPEGFHASKAITTNNDGHGFVVGSYLGYMDYQMTGSNPPLTSSFAGAVNAFIVRVDLNNQGSFKMTEITEVFNGNLSNELGINSEDLKVEAIPNPTTGETLVRLENFNAFNQYKLILRGVDGRVIYKELIEEGRHNLDLSNLSRGVYIIEIFDGLTTKSIKVIKS